MLAAGIWFSVPFFGYLWEYHKHNLRQLEELRITVQKQKHQINLLKHRNDELRHYMKATRR
jgi:hypothetical protein